MSDERRWIRAEFELARQRRAQLPEHAKPVVCSARIVTRMEHLRASRAAS